VPDAPDPLGKRALFWAPAERDEAGPRRVGEREIPGKHALFSDEARANPSLSGVGGRLATRALKKKQGPATAADRVPERLAGRRPGSTRSRFLAPVTVACSSCGATSRVDVLEFAVLHLPVWLWRPGRGYTRFMTCPACRRRTWVSASWSAPRAERPAEDTG
jgi:hypothetical protein